MPPPRGEICDARMLLSSANSELQALPHREPPPRPPKGSLSHESKQTLSPSFRQGATGVCQWECWAGVPEEFAQSAAMQEIVSLLVSGNYQHADRALGVLGSEGVGKSTLAEQVVNAHPVKHCFSDGIFWLSLGREPNITQLQKDIFNQIEQSQDFTKSKAEMEKALSQHNKLFQRDPSSLLSSPLAAAAAFEEALRKRRETLLDREITLLKRELKLLRLLCQKHKFCKHPFYLRDDVFCQQLKTEILLMRWQVEQVALDTKKKPMLINAETDTTPNLLKSDDREGHELTTVEPQNKEGLPLSETACYTYLAALLRGKKVLLVLDDVWEDTEHVRRLAALVDASTPSRLLYTSRSEEVMTALGARRFWKVEALDDTEAQQLFCRYAFQGRISPPHVLYRSVREVVKSCHGLPLSLRVLGSYFRDKRTVREWLDAFAVLLRNDGGHGAPFSSMPHDQEVDELGETPRCILSSAEALSDTDSMLAESFYLLAAFPRNFPIPISCVVDFWMVHFCIGRDVAFRLLHGLASRSLVDLLYDSDSDLLNRPGRMDHKPMNGWWLAAPGYCGHKLPIPNNAPEILQEEERSGFCHVHGSLHDLACSEYRNHGLSDALFQPDVQTLPHLEMESQPPQLLSLHSSPLPSLAPLTGPFLQSLKVLILGNCDQLSRLPSSFFEPMGRSLRFLDLSGCDNLEKLPRSVCRLSRLITLRLDGCLTLSKLPSGFFAGLRSLQVLSLMRCFSLRSLPCPPVEGQSSRLRVLRLDSCISLGSQLRIRQMQGDSGLAEPLANGEATLGAHFRPITMSGPQLDDGGVVRLTPQGGQKQQGQQHSNSDDHSEDGNEDDNNEAECADDGEIDEWGALELGSLTPSRQRKGGFAKWITIIQEMIKKKTPKKKDRKSSSQAGCVTPNAAMSGERRLSSFGSPTSWGFARQWGASLTHNNGTTAPDGSQASQTKDAAADDSGGDSGSGEEEEEEEKNHGNNKDVYSEQESALGNGQQEPSNNSASHGGDDPRQVQAISPGLTQLSLRGQPPPPHAVQHSGEGAPTLCHIPPESSTPQWTVAGVGGLTRLESLSLKSCEIESMSPLAFHLLSRLTSLDLSYCVQLKELPEEVGELVSLEVAHLEGLLLKRLPATIANLKRLRVLCISDSENLVSLPAEFGMQSALPSLQVLEMASCHKIKHMPSLEEGALPSLRVLGLAFCTRLRLLPNQLQHLPHLQLLDLAGTFCLQEFFIQSRAGKMRDAVSTLVPPPVHGKPGGIAMGAAGQVVEMLHSSDIACDGGQVEYAGTLQKSSPAVTQRRKMKEKETGFQSLKSLSLCCRRLCPSVQQRLCDLTHVEELLLTHVSLGKGGKFACVHLPNLRRLSIHFPYQPTRLLAAIVNASECQQLEELHLSCFRSSHLWRFPALEEGALPKLHTLILQGWPSLRSLPNSLSRLQSLVMLQLLDCPCIVSLPKALLTRKRNGGLKVVYRLRV